MSNYENYEVEDFLHDDFFIDWVLNPSADHHAFWDEWLLNNRHRRQTVESARRIIASVAVSPLDTDLSDNEVEDIISHVKNNLYTEVLEDDESVITKFYQSTYFRVAAILLVFIAVSFLLLKNRLQPAAQQQTAVVAFVDPYISVQNTSSSQTRVVRMDDGSLAVLKPGSSLRYLQSFAKERQVYLTGEAFFEVHKNPAIPFLVHSNDMVVRVLGTSFTVRSQNGSSKFNVIVNTGKVMVYNHKTTPKADGKDQVTLLPNQQLVFEPAKAVFVKETLQKPLTLSPEIAKKEFTFENAPFSAIVDKINQVYDVNIEYDKAKLGNVVLNASLSDRPLDQKVELICKAVNATCQFTDGRIIVTAPGN